MSNLKARAVQARDDGLEPLEKAPSIRIAQFDIGGPGCGVDGIASAVSGIAESLSDRGLSVTSVRRPRGRVPFSALRSVSGAVAAARGADIVHFHSVFRPAHLVHAVLLRRAGVPYVVSPHSGVAAPALRRQRLRKLLWISLFERRFLERAAFVSCLTELEKRDVLDRAARARCVVVPNPIGTPSRRGATPSDVGASSGPTQPYVLTLCRFDVWQKGLDVLVAVAQRLPDVRFVVCGAPDGNDPDRARRLVASAPSNVEFRAPVAGVAKAELLAGAAAYVQLSRWEGLSVSVLEAMASGTPCVVSRYIAMTLGDDCGRLATAAADDPERAAQQLRSVVFSAVEARARAERAKAFVAREYSPAEVGRRLHDAYRSAVRSASTVHGALIGG